MKRFLSFILIYCACTGTAFPQQTEPPAPGVVHVATALNHLTILEFHEPVTMAAAGSSDFQIERQENKVFVKPMKSGASTDLFVWTASRRFAYELETTQEVKNMNFAIDNSAPAPAAHLVVSPSTDQLADLMLTRAFLGAVEITSVNTRPPKNQVGVRVEQVFRTRSSVYIHYTIENNSKRSYHVAAPSAYQLQGDLFVHFLAELRTQAAGSALTRKNSPVPKVFLFPLLMRRALPKIWDQARQLKEWLPYGRI